MTSYMTKIATCVAGLAAIAAIGATSAMAISPHNPHYGPTGLRYSRGEPVPTPVQSTTAASTPMQFNLPPIAGVPFRTPATAMVMSQATSAQSTAAARTPMQLNLPPIAGVKIETPATPLVTPQVASADTGFDWSDAAVGALTTAGVCIVLMGLALGIRRRNEPKTA